MLPATAPKTRRDITAEVKALAKYPGNSRTHSADQIAQIVASIKEFGFTNPILIDDQGMIIAGHGRLEAAVVLGLTHVPAVELAGLSPAQKSALVIADNKIALNAGWDKKLLVGEMKGLLDADFNLDLLGFSGKELNGLLGNMRPLLATEDEEIEPPANPRSVLGDTWLLGAHRVHCGDCTSADAVALALGDLKPAVMVTDPPYGIDYDPGWRKRTAGIGHDASIGRTGVVLNDDRADWSEAWALFPGNIAYIWHADLHGHTVAESIMKCGYNLRAKIIWVKQRLQIGRGDYHWQHEPCLYAVKGTGNWTGDRKQSTVWQIDNLNSRAQDKENDHTNHSTQKPVECMRRPIMNNTVNGDAVYDPFLGSGSTLIAAESTGRACAGLELNPAYVDIIVRRWQNYTGKKAVHAVTGEAFDVAAAA